MSAPDDGQQAREYLRELRRRGITSPRIELLGQRVDVEEIGPDETGEVPLLGDGEEPDNRFFDSEDPS